MRPFNFNALIILLSIQICCAFALPAVAQGINTSGAGSSLGDSLSVLENKLFLHDYSSDTTNERLSRLEGMVFGKQESGSPQSRVNKLTAAISGPDVSGVPSTTATASAASASNWATSTPPARNTKTPADDSEMTSPTTSRTVSSTPSNFTQRQPMLAEYGLGKLPPAAPPVVRGSSTISSLPPAAPPLTSWVTGNFSSAPYSSSATSPSVPSYVDNLTSKVDWMENTLFGRTYNDPLPDRILRLEGKVFPQQSPATNLPLTGRVNRLLNAVSLYPPNR